MTLAEDILRLRDRSLGELAATHDYYTHTKLAWWVVLKVVRAGNQLTVRSPVTGSVTTGAEFADTAPAYVAGQLAEATFMQFVSTFENFFFDLLRLWLTAYPQSLAAREVSFKTVLEAPDKDAITPHVVNKELNEIAYERPREWVKYLEGRVKLGCPSEEEIDRIGEAKASRDLLAHNRGVANKIYKAKAGKRARFEDGQKIDLPEPYHRQTWELLRKVIAEMSAAAEAKIA